MVRDNDLEVVCVSLNSDTTGTLYFGSVAPRAKRKFETLMAYV